MLEKTAATSEKRIIHGSESGIMIKNNSFFRIFDFFVIHFLNGAFRIVSIFSPVSTKSNPGFTEGPFKLKTRMSFPLHIHHIHHICYFRTLLKLQSSSAVVPKSLFDATPFSGGAWNARPARLPPEAPREARGHQPPRFAEGNGGKQRRSARNIVFALISFLENEDDHNHMLPSKDIKFVSI